MDGKKKAVGWVVLTIICVVAAVALAVTNFATEGRIADRNLGAAQATLEQLFPDADAGSDGFENLLTEETGDLQFAYAVKQNGQTVGYAVQTTEQGYGGPIEIIVGLDKSMSLRGISVGGSDFRETEGLGSKAREDPFVSQFKGLTPPVELSGDVDAISGATVTSRAVVDGVNNAYTKLQALLNGGAGMSNADGAGAGSAEGAAGGANGAGMSNADGGSAGVGDAGAARMANASVIGYGGPVLVRLGLDDAGKITYLNVGMARFAETEGLGSRVREEGFLGQFIGKAPPLTIDDIDAVSGATVSSRAVVDAVNEAAAFLKP